MRAESVAVGPRVVAHKGAVVSGPKKAREVGTGAGEEGEGLVAGGRMEEGLGRLAARVFRPPAPPCSIGGVGGRVLNVLAGVFQVLAGALHGATAGEGRNEEKQRDTDRELGGEDGCGFHAAGVFAPTVPPDRLQALSG